MRRPGEEKQEIWLKPIEVPVAIDARWKLRTRDILETT
jgi:hypothetical protein